MGDKLINRNGKRFGIGEFARQAGVTTRTIRYYDKLGLLKPSAYSAVGRRLYTELDYAKLQQILTLKLIGLSLEEIKSLLTTDAVEIAQLLERQKMVLKQQVQQLSTLIQTIEQAQHAMHDSQLLDWQQFVNIIKAVNMKQHVDWFSQFITDEQQKKLVNLSQNWTLADQKKIGEEWRSLFIDIHANKSHDVTSPEAQKLADRWQQLIAQLTQGDADFATRLNNAYIQIDTALDSETAAPTLKNWTRDMRDAAIFVQKVRTARDHD